MSWKIYFSVSIVIFVHFSENDEQLKKSHIIIADYDLLAPYIYKLPNLKWQQGTWAGIEIFLRKVQPNNPPPFTISRFTGKHYGTLISEYVIANIINFERAIYEISDNQKMCKWNRDGKISAYRPLPELTIGIMGLGSIGNISMFWNIQCVQYKTASTCLWIFSSKMTK